MMLGRQLEKALLVQVSTPKLVQGLHAGHLYKVAICMDEVKVLL